MEFLNATGGVPNLENSVHRTATLKWLRKWGCRQFAVRDNSRASTELRRWYAEHSGKLFQQSKNIWELSDRDYEIIKNAYAELIHLRASSRHQGNRRNTKVRFGPTAAAKILFTIRPAGLAPWDRPIRKELSLNGTPQSYVAYIKRVAEMLERLKPACTANGFTLSDLPTKLLRSSSSVPKLIDEYYWVTITKKWKLPDSTVLDNWSRWGHRD